MNWKNNKRWVYSITYDEGIALLLQHALPVHRRFHIPGHVSIVASQIGVARNVPGSSYNGMTILSREEIRMLTGEGWGVSCHGMTHGSITKDNAKYEVVESKKVLEDSLGIPISVFCVPGNNDNFPASREVANDAGYSAIMTIYDRVNTLQSDLLSLGRCPIHTQYPGPFYSVFDPYKRLHQAVDCGGWVIDYCHCPMPGKPVHPNKDCTVEELTQRFETVLKVGGDEVWLAEVNEVVDYMEKNNE